MANYKLRAWQDKTLVVDKEFGDHWDLACQEFSGLMCCLAYDAVTIQNSDEGLRMVAAFYHPLRPPLGK